MRQVLRERPHDQRAEELDPTVTLALIVSDTNLKDTVWLCCCRTKQAKAQRKFAVCVVRKLNLRLMLGRRRPPCIDFYRAGRQRNDDSLSERILRAETEEPLELVLEGRHVVMEQRFATLSEGTERIDNLLFGQARDHDEPLMLRRRQLCCHNTSRLRCPTTLQAP